MNQQKLIAQIHSEFDTAQERLLSQANEILKSKSTNDVALADRLKAIGFTGSKVVERTEESKKLIVKSKSEAELIQYYTTTYPFLKFLTEAELHRICSKYNLIFMPVENFIGDVPEKNVAEIEQAQKIKDIDTPPDVIYCELQKDNSFFLASGDGTWSGIWGKEWYRIPKRIEGEHFHSPFDVNRFLQRTQRFTCTYLVSRIENCIENRLGLFICAPKSQFKGNAKNITKLIPEVKDPIVFRYVRGGIQVLTKWGLEANDPALVIPKLN